MKMARFDANLATNVKKKLAHFLLVKNVQQIVHGRPCHAGGRRFDVKTIRV
jgi:hypothetical protein